MFKLKKRDITILLYCTIAIFAFFFIYKMFYSSKTNNIEAFSIKQTWRKQNRKLKNFNNKHVKKYTSKIGNFFKSIF